MKLFSRRKRPAQAPRRIDTSLLEDRSEERRQTFTDQCERVRSPQGRNAHLRHPEHGVLCGWKSVWTDADPSLPLCRLCETAALAADGRRAS